LIISTPGWLKGLTFIKWPIVIISSIKWHTMAPKDSADNSFKITLLIGNFFTLRAFMVAVKFALLISGNSLWAKYPSLFKLLVLYSPTFSLNFSM